MEPTKNEALPKDAASEEAKKKRQRKIIAWLIIVLLFLLALYFLLSRLLFPKPTIYGNTINVNQPVEVIEVNENNLLATTTEAAKRAKAIAESENFEMLQINLEGSGTNVFDLGETELFAINSVKSELYSTKEGDKTEIRAVISGQTNKRSYVEVEYFKSGEKNKRVIKDTYLGYGHILVIPALDPDSVYRYSVSATDLNQTVIYSDQYVFYTGVGNISLVDVLGSAVQKVFGWAIGR
ncbi:MAG: hypothetical protein Q7K35_03575 [bacterium]|nr:hypothetical protein [bacterium]